VVKRHQTVLIKGNKIIAINDVKIFDLAKNITTIDGKCKG
jgi:hypothetical protein